MSQFVRFKVDDLIAFQAFQRVFDVIKQIKNLDWENAGDDESGEWDYVLAENSGPFDSTVEPEYDLDKIRNLIPVTIRSNFIWPSAEEIQRHKVDQTRPLAISRPGMFFGKQWSLVRVLDLIDSCEYTLDRCEMVADGTAELHIETRSYPYGGLNALIALVEGFGFYVVGVNECGRYESRDELEQN